MNSSGPPCTGTSMRRKGQEGARKEPRLEHPGQKKGPEAGPPGLQHPGSRDPGLEHPGERRVALNWNVRGCIRRRRRRGQNQQEEVKGKLSKSEERDHDGGRGEVHHGK